MKFYSLYDNFHVFYNSFFLGNEIEFLHDGEKFYILPLFDDNDNVIGIQFGKPYDDKACFCFSEEELFNISIGNTLLGDILEDVEIIWNNL